MKKVSDVDSKQLKHSKARLKASQSLRESLERPLGKSDKLKLIFLVLTFWVMVEMALRERLYEATIPIINFIRANLATKHSDIFFRVISELADKSFVATLIIVSVFFLDTPKAFLQAILSFSSLALITILKTVNHEARPFFSHEV